MKNRLFDTAVRLAGAGVLLALPALAAQASSADAWASGNKEAAAACVAASGFTAAKTVGKPAIFDDATAQTAYVVRGKFPQTHMRGETGQVLCLYDRRGKKATTVEWATPKS